MQIRKPSLLRIAFEIILIMLTLILRAVSLSSSAGEYSNYFVMLSALAAGAVIAFNSVSRKPYLPVFKSEKSRLLKLVSYLLSLGLFVEFINRCIASYYIFDGNSGSDVLPLVFRALGAAFALLSSIYFIPAGLTFGGERYDVRSLRVFHIVPLLWALFRLLEVMEQAGMDSKNDVSGVLKYTMLAFALCFFFCFAGEVESQKGARGLTAVFARETVFFSALYSADGAMLFLFKKPAALPFEATLYFTAFTLFLFSAALVKNIISDKFTEI